MTNRLKEKCASCLFYYDESCKRYPPVVVGFSETAYYDNDDQTGHIEGHTTSKWPIVDESDWCGEYRFKERIPND